jgi:hypothetical protein
VNRLGLIALAPAFVAGYILAAVPNYAALESNAGNAIESRPNAEVLAQAGTTGLQGQELQLLNQIEADTAQLKADAEAERTGRRHVNPQIRFIRASLLHLAAAAESLRNTTEHYRDHRAQALQAMAEAHNHLMQCYRIDSQLR